MKSCWIRKASLVFGSNTLALSTVLVVFFAGLAIGSTVFGKLSVRSRSPLLFCGVLEISVGLLALCTPDAFAAADTIYGQFYELVTGHFYRLTATRLIMLTILLLPPGVLMSGTLPLYCRHFVTNKFHRAPGELAL